MSELLGGVGVALVTVFDDQGGADPGAAAALAGDAAAQLALADRHLEARDGGPAALKRVLAKTRPMPAVSRVP